MPSVILSIYSVWQHEIYTLSGVKRSSSCILITLAHLIGTEELAGYGFFCDGLFPTLTVRTLTKKVKNFKSNITYMYIYFKFAFPT